MDIAGLSMAMASNNLQTQVGTAVLSKAMDTNEALGQGIVQMMDSAAMERSVTPELGTNIDLRI
ncbi:YjfB family protein [Simiaoa sp.]|uniref:YjfB family protein n=1 Tax=Simiaoa sp. TaxID=2944202 RepID=UPI003F7F8F0B